MVGALMPSTFSYSLVSRVNFSAFFKDARFFLSHVTPCTLLRGACFLSGDFNRAIIVC